jgi:selenocysteine lyase/cysteine desulfurase
VSFSVNGYSPDEVADILENEYNIELRTGYHCAPLVHEFLSTKDQLGTIRASFSAFTTFNEIDHLLNAIGSLKE